MINQMHTIRQLPLIVQKQSEEGGAPYYEIQRGGIDYLRQIGNRRLRIILNIASQVNLQPFCDHFMGNVPIKSNNAEERKGWLSYLSIYSQKEELADGRVLLIMNARYLSGTPNADYLLLGYMMSSLMIFHGNGSLDINNKGTNKQPIVRHLSRLSERLHNTDITQLNAKIRFEKKPYLLYLMSGVKGDQNSAKEQFWQFFKGLNKDDSQQYKKAAEALIDYFPNRTAFYVNDYNEVQAIKKMKANFIEKIVGRKLFNFEVTGRSVQLLCLQMCDHFNTTADPTLDLAKLYTRVMQQQKQRLLNEGVQMYIRSLSQYVNNTIFPVEAQELFHIRDNVNKQTVQLVKSMAVNCVDLPDYLYVRDQINKKTSQRWADAAHSNLKASRDLNANLVSQFTKNSWDQDSNMDIVREQLIEKVHLFAYQSVGSTAKGSMAEFVQILIEKMCEITKLKLRSKDEIIEMLDTQSLQYRQKVLELEDSLQKCENRLERHFDRMGMSVRQAVFEQDEEWNEHRKEVKQLKDRIKSQEENYFLKTLELDEIYDQLDRYNFMLEQSKVKKSAMNTFSTQITSSVRSFLKGIEELEDFKKSFQKQFNRKKQEWEKQLTKCNATIRTLRTRTSTLQKQIQKLTVNLKLSHETINIYASITGKSKGYIQQANQQQSELKVIVAEQQSRIILYQKSIELIAQHIKQGTKDSLVKFAKINADQNLRRLLSGIVD